MQNQVLMFSDTTANEDKFLERLEDISYRYKGRCAIYFWNWLTLSLVLFRTS
jgi:hypothetical protein